ncbi:MAG: hypothetical protein H6604_02200 [Flavobacteriales bacterium]|nr:hypothetical protein [Flavobacteriales bacterium]
MNTFIIQADNKISKVLVTLCKALDLSFEIKKESPYNSDFVEMVLKSSNDESEISLTEDYKKKLFQNL